MGDLGSIPRLGRSPGEEKSYPLQYSGLENSMNCIVHGVSKSQTGLNDLHFHFHNLGKILEAELSLFPANKKMGDTEKFLCPGTPQGPAWFQLPCWLPCPPGLKGEGGGAGFQSNNN